MENSHSEAYAAAGVNIEAGYEGVKRMQKHVRRTLIPGVLSDIGGFGGLFQPDTAGMEEPVLVSGTDGVGTKQRIAQLMGKHDTVGIDCVAMCVNDIICCGARPLFFLDYIAIGKNEPEKVAALVAGVAEGCVQAGCALIGGETAEHPGTMQPEDYDLAGFSVGIVDRKKILNREDVQPGDLIFGLPSSGVHSNGFSLVRKVFDIEHADLGKEIRSPAGSHAHLCQARTRGAEDRRHRRHQPYHGRRLLREHPPLSAGRRDGTHREKRGADASGLPSDSGDGQDLGAGYVQHLQHGHRHEPGRQAGEGGRRTGGHPGCGQNRGNHGGRFPHRAGMRRRL